MSTGREIERRIVRIDQIEQRLVNNRAGYTTGELARMFSVSPDTIRRDLDLLEQLGMGFVLCGRRYIVHHRRPHICQQCGKW